MAERRATVRLVATGDRSVRDALNGVTRAVQANSREQQRLAREQAQREKAAARERLQTERATAREKEKLAREESRRIEKLERERVAAARRAAREEQRIAEQSARARARAEQQAAREQQRLGREREQRMSTLRQGVLATGSILVGGATQLVNRAQATAGVGSLEERIRAAGSFGTQLIQFAGAADLSATERDAMGQRILETSDRSGIRAGELLSGINEAMSRFGAGTAMDLAGMLDQLADASVASGASVQDLIGLLGTASQAYRLSGDELQEFLGSTIEATRAGSIEARDFAGNFASSLAIYAETTGRRGIAGAREAVGLAEVIGTGQFGAAESATRFEALIRQLSDSNVQQRFRRAGVQVADRQGNLLPMEQIVANVQGSRRLSTARGMSSLQLDSRAQQALMILRARGVAGLREFAQADAESGHAYVRATAAEIGESSYSRLTAIGTRAENETIRDADRIIESYRSTVESVTELQSEFPILTEVMGTLTSAVQALIPALLISAGLRGGGTAAVSAAASALGIGGSAAAASGGGALAAAGGLSLGSAAMIGLPVAAAVGGTAYMLHRNEQDAAGNAAIRAAAERGTDEALGRGDFNAAREAFAVTLEASGQFQSARQARRGVSTGSVEGSAFLAQAAGGQPVRLAPESIDAMAAAFRSGLPEGTAGEGAPGRGRRSAEAPHARR